MKPLGLVICLPTRNEPSIETSLCIEYHLDGYPSELLTVSGKPVVEARNLLAKLAREIEPSKRDFDPSYCLWSDDDSFWYTGTVDRAVTILEENPDVSMVSGVFCKREAFASAEAGNLVPVPGYRTLFASFAPLRYRMGQLVEIDLTGGHWFVCRRDLLAQVGDDPFDEVSYDLMDPHRLAGEPEAFAPEDFSFCYRVRSLGKKIVIERSLRIGHVDVNNGLVYYRDVAPLRVNGLHLEYDRALKENPPRGTVRTYFEPLQTERAAS
jgi:hypothetical protein